MSLDMYGHIDSTFASVVGTQIVYKLGGYSPLGIWLQGAEEQIEYIVNMQPMSEREISALEIGGERIEDYRKIYINQGDFHALSPKAFWVFDVNEQGKQTYKAISTDIRVWRSYAKIIIVKQDNLA